MWSGHHLFVYLVSQTEHPGILKYELEEAYNIMESFTNIKEDHLLLMCRSAGQSYCVKIHLIAISPGWAV
jgi:hypothetical protein